MCLVVFAASCGPAIYEIPAPPPEEEWTDRQLDPSAEEEASAERYAEARRAVLALYEALQEGDYEAAYYMLSNETRILLDTYGGGVGDEALANGLLEVDGTTYAFDPVDLLLMPEPASFEDSVRGEEENETSRRKEIFIFDADEAYRRVVVIREADEWVIHAPRVPTDRLDVVPAQ